MTLITSRCLSCDKELDAATAAEGDVRPSPGDCSVCFYCGHIMAFADDMTLRELTGAEAYEVAGHPHVIAIQKARAVLNKIKKKSGG